MREQAEREQNRLIRSSRRSRLEDASKSKAMDELKAKRSAGRIMCAVHGVFCPDNFLCWPVHIPCTYIFVLTLIDL